MSAAVREGRGGQRQSLKMAIGASSLGFALVQLDVSIVNVALARIGADLGSGVSGLQWVVDAYAIVFASLLLSAGALGDRVGARRVFTAGFALFAVASMACAAAPTTTVLVVARALQGVGAAPLVPCSLALLTHACGEDAAARGRAVSLWTAAGSVSLAAGPLCGGVLVDWFGWRTIFVVNLPVCVVAIWLTDRHVAETPAAVRSLDASGQVFAVLALLGLTGAIIEAGRLGIGAPVVLGAFMLAVFAAGAFGWTEMRSSEPMLPLGFFRQSSFSAATAVGWLINFTVYGMIFVLGLYFQRVRGWSPTISGLLFLPFSVVLGIANVAAGWTGARWGMRLPMVAGLIVGALGYWLLRQLNTTLPYSAMLPGLVLVSAGVGLSVPLMTSALLGGVPRSRAGAASGVLNSVRQAGGAMGVAVCGALLAEGGIGGVQTAATFSAALLGCAAAVASVGVGEICARGRKGDFLREKSLREAGE
jgi:MFS transporter, DHA2 family, methylenomycin A resistance protein